MKSSAWLTWSGVKALARRCWLALVYSNEPWNDGALNVTSKGFRRMVARARLDERRERGAGICWTYSRDRVVERRELRCESAEQKRRRLTSAKQDKTGLRLIA